jgi:hypothetical protein
MGNPVSESTSVRVGNAVRPVVGGIMFETSPFTTPATAAPADMTIIALRKFRLPLSTLSSSISG